MSENDTITADVAPQDDAPPEWLPGKFWDAEKKAPNVEGLAKSYRELESMTGRKVSDLSPEARRKLAESLPDEMRATWAEEVKAKLVEDDEFLTPLREKWAEGLPKAPEAYDLDAVTLPDGLELDRESPALTQAAEWAKARGIDQDGFGELLALGAQLLAPAPPLEERMATFGDDYGTRATAIVNKARAAAGADPHAKQAVEAILAEMHSPEALRGLELILAQRGEKPAPDETAAARPATLSKHELQAIQARDDYHARPDLQAQVRQGFSRLYGEIV
jgi:hypothetical protein